MTSKDKFAAAAFELPEKIDSLDVTIKETGGRLADEIFHAQVCQLSSQKESLE